MIDTISRRQCCATNGLSALVIAADQMWETLCTLLGCAELTTNPRFLTSNDHRSNRDALTAILNQSFLTRNADEWMALFDKNGVPAGVVNTLDRVINDPQIAHRDMVMSLKADDGRAACVIGDPIFFEESPRPTPRFPAAGEDSAAVLRDALELRAGEIEALVQAGVAWVRGV